MLTKVDFDIEGKVFRYLNAQKCLEEADFLKYLGKFTCASTFLIGTNKH